MLRRLVGTAAVRRPGGAVQRVALARCAGDTLDADIQRYSPAVNRPGRAGRWARTLFIAAGVQGNRDVVQKDMQAVQAVFRGSADLRDALESPVLASADKSRLMAQLLDRLNADDVTKRLVERLVETRHTKHLATVAKYYEDMCQAERGEVTLQITSASTLSAADVETIKAVLSDNYLREGQQLTVETAVDPALVGGVTLQMGDTLIDCSLSSELRRIEDAMRAAVHSYFDDQVALVSQAR